MARKMKGTNSASNIPTATKIEKAPTQDSNIDEIKNWYSKNKKHIENYAEAMDGIHGLRDVTKSSTTTISSFTKESLRTYLTNITSNEKNLRNLSRYLYYRCHPYYRLVAYNANMFCLDARSVIPNYDLVNDALDKESILSSYQDTINILDKLHLQYEFLKIYMICFREDVFYGCALYDENQGLWILPLDPDYCKISGAYATGDFSFSMDMSYFRSRQTVLEIWGKPFTSMYNDYQSSGEKWQPMPDEYAVCLKTRAEDWETVIPPFSGLLSGIINLIDLDDLQSIADKQDIYKMIWLELETITNSDMADDWKISPDIVIEYFNRMINEALPEYTSAAIVPGKLDQISFNNDKATDTNKISKSTETLFNTSGGAQILNSSTISGTTAFTAAIQSDTEMAISMLLPQTQAWVQRFISYHVSNPAKVKFFEVSAYTKDAFKESMLKGAQNGLPTKLAYNTLNQFSEKDTLSLNFLEEEILQLSQKLVPIATSYTQSSSSNTGGAPEKDITELTDDGEASRDKQDNKN